MVGSTEVELSEPRSDARPAGPTYWCHECMSTVATTFNVETHEVECQRCNGCFVEELEEDTPPQDSPQTFVPPTNEPSEVLQDAPAPSSFRLAIDGRDETPEVVPLTTRRVLAARPRETGRPLTSLLDAASNGAARTTRNRIFTHTGTGQPVEVYITGGNAGGGGGLLGAISSVLQLHTGQGPTTTIGDYAFGNISTIINQLMQNDANQHGAPPAAKAAVDSLPVVHITEEDVAKNQDCAVCKDMFTLKEEVRRLPCAHDFHPDCILPWLAQHNSCPVCRFELPTDDPDYENHKSASNERRSPPASTL
ncbi:hypothetical protein ACHHYP_11722 [Achlya hypogyna]|uniref:RING-type domain-containing protein n=1 Tax=Achlya hypogyna TaxID=1202772 RepID=A0A1V9YIJ7_ACHHY|nr:hypothetical protein ACHHYP_11722 [Achlya hypogyna]